MVSDTGGHGSVVQLDCADVFGQAVSLTASTDMGSVVPGAKLLIMILVSEVQTGMMPAGRIT